MNPKIPLMGGWAIPKDRQNGTDSQEARNRQQNLATKRQLVRLYFGCRVPGGFDPEDTDVLCEGVTYRKQLEVCARDNVGVSICIGLSYNGLEHGYDYHGATGGRSAWPVIDDNGVRVRRFTNDVLRLAQQIGVDVWAVECGNEEGYQPSLEVPWDTFEVAYISTLRKVEGKVRQLLGPNVYVVSGGQSGQSVHHGHKGINKAISDAGLSGQIVGTIHGNGMSDGDFREGIIDLFDMGFLRVVVNEDRPTSGPSRLIDRANIADSLGCLAIGFFDCRNVNALGTNGCNPCSWQVRGGCGSPRPELSIFGCNDFNVNRWDELVGAAEWAGTDTGEPILPWRVTGPPPPPPPPSTPDPPGWGKYQAMKAAEAAGNLTREKKFFDEWRKKWDRTML